MIATRKLLSFESQTVRLTPLTVTEPFSTVQSPAPCGSYSKVKYQLPSASSFAVQTAVWSTCPCTMCPSSRASGFIDRSRLTRSPSRSNPRLLLSSVSFMAVTV